ncbi:hypothetical protein PV05_10841 [Exophiala xenobiotica]|uniref:NmrA-like domain-containing protein n=1 Tax=Exophiala xenobiotica TaxID=348802 RepID=A0A0D2E121_9EURO|nr:uncharacterized protein PV05_10841 [Exophiala xenobiotica]KIW49133.1 hypothetical protein PV05_10841 [Exophiala xenobiotica]MBV36845.1 hypothetical protein [Rickettsiales bacterium]
MSVKVAVAGGTGNLGPHVVNALLAANYSVTVLTRKGSTSTSKLPKSPNLSVVEVDYSSVTSLTEALKGHDVVVSTLATESLGSQYPLIDAAIAAGVKRFIPSEFGSDTTHPKSSKLPVYKYKVETQHYLQAKSAEHPEFTYTLVLNGAFLSWGIKVGFLVNVANHSATVWNGGDVPFSATNLETVGEAVAGVIQHLPETANRPVYVQGARITQNQLIKYAKEKDGVEWQLTPKETAKAYEEASAELAKGPNANIGAAMVGYLMSAIFDESYGPDFSSHLDNDLLGIKGMTEADVRKMVESFLPSSSSL